MRGEEMSKIRHFGKKSRILHQRSKVLVLQFKMFEFNLKQRSVVLSVKVEYVSVK